MNIAMESTEVCAQLLEAECNMSMPLKTLKHVLTNMQEYVNGQLKNKFGDAFIRGNNGEMSACPITLC